jgi:hypothetical protein
MIDKGEIVVVPIVEPECGLTNYHRLPEHNA